MTDDQEVYDPELTGGVLCHVVIQTHANKAERSREVEAWGLIDRDNFILLHSFDAGAWQECGDMPTPITLTDTELRSVSHAPGAEPDYVLTALAQFRLTGERPKPMFK